MSVSAGVASSDLGRRVAHVTVGVAKMMLLIQSGLDDIEGALRAGQFHLVAYRTRTIVINALAVRSVGLGGEPFAFEDPTTHDPFFGIPAADLDEASALVSRATTLDASSAEQFEADLAAWVARVEAEMRLPEPIPVLRSPDGMFGAIRLAREWGPLADQLDLPPVIPHEWSTSI